MLPKPLLLITLFLFPAAMNLGCSGCGSAGPPPPQPPQDGPKLVWMDPGDPSQVSAEFKRLLHERHGVGYSWGLRHIKRGDIEANNEKVKAALEAKHGTGVVENLRAEADANVKAGRGRR